MNNSYPNIKILKQTGFEFVKTLPPKEYLIVCGKRYDTLEEVCANSTSKIIHKLCDTGYEVHVLNKK